MSIVSHVAIIMDGNGRWAKKRGLPRVEGHRQGLVTAEKIIEYSLEAGVKYLSLFVFSTENWKRPKTEISALFSLAEKYLDKFEAFCKNRVRVVVSGNKNRLPQRLVEKIAETEKNTAGFSDICVNLLIDYGGRADICNAAQSLAEKGLPITEENLASALYNSFIPNPDVIIRTGGEMRLSNFLLFQSAYSELFFTNTLWPDFQKDEYFSILQSFGQRKRNFGAVSD